MKAVFFDMGNTLLDFHNGISDSDKDRLGAEAIAEYLTILLKKEISAETVWIGFIQKWLGVMPQRKNRTIEFDPYEFLTSFLMKEKVKLTKKQMFEVLKLCDVGYQNYLTVLPGAIELLSSLKERELSVGVISNSPQIDEVNIDHFKSVGLDEYIDQYTFSYGANCRKPDLGIFKLAIEKFGVKSRDCLMIGDRMDNDILPAKEIGMETAWVNIDNKVNDSQIGTICAGSLGELKEII